MELIILYTGRTLSRTTGEIRRGRNDGIKDNVKMYVVRYVKKV